MYLLQETDQNGNGGPSLNQSINQSIAERAGAGRRGGLVERTERTTIFSLGKEAVRGRGTKGTRRGRVLVTQLPKRA